jgi:RNA polymerase sigma factor (sigma-70 family)
LWRALGRLPAKQRAVLVLRYFEDLTEEQIATTLGVRAGTVKSQASKALARLRLDESLRLDNTGRR